MHIRDERMVSFIEPREEGFLWRYFTAHREVKPDGKLNLSVREKAFIQMDKDALLVLARLEEKGGVLPFNDKADAEVIRAEFDLSKNAFKRAVGHLYKERKIEIRKDSIVLK